jgi:uncharacterized membrane protein (DUF485 family)
MNEQPILDSWAASSSDATQVANTVKGAIVAVSSIIILLAAQFFHVTLSATDVLGFATDAGITVGFIWFLAGLMLKGIHALAAKRPVQVITA